MTTAWDGYGEARMPTTCDVYEDDPQPTGLLDRWGNPLIRQREPIGFRLTATPLRNDNASLSCPPPRTDQITTPEDRK